MAGCIVRDDYNGQFVGSLECDFVFGGQGMILGGRGWIFGDGFTGKDQGCGCIIMVWGMRWGGETWGAKSVIV